MEKTLAIHLAEQREQIAREIEYSKLWNDKEIPTEKVNVIVQRLADLVRRTK